MLSCDNFVDEIFFNAHGLDKDKTLKNVLQKDQQFISLFSGDGYHWKLIEHVTLLKAGLFCLLGFHLSLIICNRASI